MLVTAAESLGRGGTRPYQARSFETISSGPRSVGSPKLRPRRVGSRRLLFEFLESPVMADLKDFAETGGVDFPGDAGRARMPRRGKERRRECRAKAGIIENDHPARFQVTRAELPILSDDFVIVVAIDVDHV